MLMITVHPGPHGELETVMAQASYRGFSGQTELRFVGIQAVNELTDDLAGFPSSIRDVRQTHLSGFDRNLLSIALSCTDSIGHASARIVIGEAGELPSFAVTLTMPVVAAGIDAFVAQLRRVCSARSGEAVLATDELADENLAMEKLDRWLALAGRTALRATFTYAFVNRRRSLIAGCSNA
jgi:hypothetical protein